MNGLTNLLLAAAVSLMLALPDRAAAVRVDAVEVDLVADRDAVVPGQPLTIALRIRHDPHWHTYWRFAGDSGLPTVFEPVLPEGWKIGEILWPAPTRLNVGPLANYGFEGEVLLPRRIEAPATASSGEVRIGARVQWLMCREVCIPGEAKLGLALPVRSSAMPAPVAAEFAKAIDAGPRGTMKVRAGLGEGRVSLLFEGRAIRSAEFFPYREGLIRSAAPQRLHRIGDAGDAWRLDLEPADPPAGRDAWRPAPAGLLRIDDRSFEVEVGSADRVPDGGALVAIANGVEVVKPGSAGSGLLRDISSDRSASGAAPPEAPGLAMALAGGLAGGLILNLMPCVFPVIGLKVLGFAGHGAGDRRAGRRSALAFAAGVLLSFWVLAAVLVALRAAGQAVGWGFQLQSPGFVTAMTLLFVVIGLNFAGVFEIGVGLTRLGSLERGGGPTAAFGSGILAVLVATPCTAPFMGSALGYTLGRSAAELFAVFTSVAAGMAVPYLLLGSWPRALGWLPKPGRWMESFRQFLAFPMFATAAWLLWVLAQQSGVDAVLGVALGAVLIGCAAWAYGRFVQSAQAVHGRLAAGFALACVAAAVRIAWPADEHADDAKPRPSSAQAGDAGRGRAEAAGPSGVSQGSRWEAWSEARVSQALAEGRTVFVDFTAAWCVTCQVNKRLVLQRDPVASEFARRGVVLLRADWTNQDPAITRALAAHGRNGVPMYLLMRPGGATPTLLPEILTSGIVLRALDGG